MIRYIAVVEYGTNTAHRPGAPMRVPVFQSSHSEATRCLADWWESLDPALGATTPLNATILLDLMALDLDNEAEIRELLLYDHVLSKFWSKAHLMGERAGRRLERLAIESEGS